MTELKCLVLNFRAEELVVRVLYRTKAGPNPGTVARRWEVADPARSGHLMWGRSPYTLQVASYEPSRWRARTGHNGGQHDGPQQRA